VWSAGDAETYLLTPTRVSSDSQLTARVDASLLKHPVSVEVRVVNGDVVEWWEGYREYPVSNALSFAVISATGRWKLGGDGSCYFDASDSGANQCEPSEDATRIRR